MRNVFTRFSALTSVILVVGGVTSAVAQHDMQPFNAGTPRYAVIPARQSLDAAAPAATLQTWKGSFSYRGKNYPFTMVGTTPVNGAPTTINVKIIPIKLIVTSGGRQFTVDPNKTLPNGRTVVQNTVDSPIFDSTTTYVQGGVNVGTTQYLDAYQRANFWAYVQSNPSYHVTLNPTVLPTQTFTVPSSKGTIGKPFGHYVAEVDLNWFDAQALSLITSLGITADTFPIFLTYETYLTSGGCCIGGYHSASGAQTYTQASYLDYAGDFSQDVSALSHEIGEWYDDPFVNQTSPCGGLLENGDPLEGLANFGAFPYTVNGFTYNLQDLVTLPYFGANPAVSVNRQFTFQGTTLSVCQYGQ